MHSKAHTLSHTLSLPLLPFLLLFLLHCLLSESATPLSPKHAHVHVYPCSTITADAHCAKPLHKGDTFNMVSPDADPSKWVRIPAAIQTVNITDYAYAAHVHDPEKVEAAYSKGHNYDYGWLRGKADIYKGRLDNIAGDLAHHVKCGKMMFVADFIDETGTVQCPTQPADSGVGPFDPKDFTSTGPVPAIKCGTYSLVLSTGGSYGPYDSYHSSKYRSADEKYYYENGYETRRRR